MGPFDTFAIKADAAWGDVWSETLQIPFIPQGNNLGFGFVAKKIKLFTFFCHLQGFRKGKHN